MDALSENLKLIRLTGGVFLDASFTAPWSVTTEIGPDDCTLVTTRPEAVVAFHYLIEGRMIAAVPGADPIEVLAGEIVLLPHSGAHLLASEAGLATANGRDLIRPCATGTLARIEHGGGGALTRMVCGFIGCESRRQPLLAILPALLKLSLNGRRAADWVATSFRFAAQEVAEAKPGSAMVLAKLSELLFVEAVRDYVAGLSAERTGWLAGLKDPAIGRALALIHGRPAEPWTTEALAAEVHLSRSAFAERFVQLVGEAPMTFLTRWRMQVAGERLRSTRLAIAQIAASVGYDSEASFTRAFKRTQGVSPGRFRTQA